MTPPDLTPEQMNERLVSDFCALIENRCGTVRGIGPAVREGLPKLFADDQCDSCRALAVLDLIEKGDTDA